MVGGCEGPGRGTVCCCFLRYLLKENILYDLDEDTGRSAMFWAWSAPANACSGGWPPQSCEVVPRIGEDGLSAGLSSLRNGWAEAVT